MLVENPSKDQRPNTEFCAARCSDTWESGLGRPATVSDTSTSVYLLSVKETFASHGGARPNVR